MSPNNEELVGYRKEELKSLLNFVIIIKPKLENKKNSLLRKIENDSSKELLELSYSQFIDSYDMIYKYGFEDKEGRLLFNKVIDQINLNLFGKLRDAISVELGISQDVENYIFFKDFYYYLNYKFFITQYPNEKIYKNGTVFFDSSISINVEDFFKPSSYFKELNKYLAFNLQKKKKFIPMGYITILKNISTSTIRGFKCNVYSDYNEFITDLRNATSQHWSLGSLPKDFIYDNKYEYGNFFIAAKIFCLCCYAYLEILDRWNEYC